MHVSFALALLLASSDAPDLRATLMHLLDAPEHYPGMRLRELILDEERAAIGLELPDHVELDRLPVEVENAYELAVGAISAQRPNIARIDLSVAHRGEKLRPPKKYPIQRPPPGPRYSVVPDPMRFPDGQALLDKTIAISPGHGYIYYDNLNGYSTQRGRVSWTGCGDCRGIVEDFETHEIVVRYLIPLLEGAGARVVLVRERDYNNIGLVIDNGETGYSELAGNFNDGSSAGGHSGDYRTTSSAGGSAEFTLTAQSTGPQLLSTWFVAGSNRPGAVELELTGPFGIIDLIFDQRTHGRRWAPIQLLDLNLGDDVKVKLTNPANNALIADAVRLGAGLHSSGHRYWEMGAFPFAEFQNAPNEVLAYGDVTVRPVYAEFYGADVYVALHSNASGAADSTAAGISTYRYNCGTYPDHSADPPAADCDDPSGSDRLQAAVHSHMVDQLKADWDPNWVDRGPKVANFGELRELDGIPGMLIESAFHDQVRLASGSMLRVTDNQSLHDPRWRRSAAYGIYAGLSEFFGATALLAPPPKELAVKRVSSTELSVDFETVEGAIRYRVYTARGGRTFDLGRIVNVPPAVIDGLTPEELVHVRVASLNAAGEGIPGNIVSARPSAKRAQILLVDSFEREDAWIQDLDNMHNTVQHHAAAIAHTGVAFDGATEAAITAGRASFTGYDGAIISLGAESTEHSVLTELIRLDLRDFSDNGGAIFISGSELGWALDERGNDVSRAFLADVFGASYGRDDAAVYSVGASAGGWLSTALMSEAELDDGTKGALRARSSDVLNPLAGSTIELVYGTGMEAAAVRKNKNIALGFSVDSLTSPAARAAILGAFVDNAIPMIPVDPPDAGTTPLDADTMEEDATVHPDAGDVPAPDAGVIVEPPDAGLDINVNVEEPEGCSCNQTKTPRADSALFALAVLLLLKRRRNS